MTAPEAVIVVQAVLIALLALGRILTARKMRADGRLIAHLRAHYDSDEAYWDEGGED